MEFKRLYLVRQFFLTSVYIKRLYNGSDIGLYFILGLANLKMQAKAAAFKMKPGFTLYALISFNTALLVLPSIFIGSAKICFK